MRVRIETDPKRVVQTSPETLDDDGLRFISKCREVLETIVVRKIAEREAVGDEDRLALLAAAALVPFVKVSLPGVSVQLPLSSILMVACGLCISVMFGGIFNLATDGLGRLVPVASGITMSLVSGGALLALIGVVTDRFGILSSCWVFSLFLCYIFLFAVVGSRAGSGVIRQKNKETE